jgi:DNA repair exonuclease SbcCD ATPase subunit
MSIHSIKIQNFKGLKSFKGEVLGRDIYLTGRNGAGKTSFIEAVWLALTGKNIPTEPVTKGEKKGLIEVTLDDGYTVRVKLSKTGKTPVSFEIENLNAEGPEDQFVKAPRTWLNNRIGVIDFDVNTFFAMSAQKQVEYFCKVSGIDVSDIDVSIEEISDSRKYDKKRLAEMQTKTGFYKVDDAAKELIDVVALANEIAELKESERTKQEDFTKVQNGVAAREQQLIANEQELARLVKAIEDLSAASDKIVDEVEAGKAWLQDPANIPGENPVLLAKTQEFENAATINKTIEDAKAFAAADKEIDKLIEAIETATEEIQKERERKGAAIAEKINIEGLVFDTETETFLFNGLPFEKTQINTASQIIAGLKIGASLLNDVKILKLDASLIDKENFTKIQEWSKSEGIELFVELVDREGSELKIQIDESE